MLKTPVVNMEPIISFFTETVDFTDMANILDEIMMEYVYRRIEDSEDYGENATNKILQNIQLVRELRNVFRVMAIPVLTPALLPCV